MPKEWILNNTMNRFQLNFKRNVGATSGSIRLCTPKSIDEWKRYYFENVRPKEHIEELGRKLYVKITEVVQAEIEDISEQDCIEYMINMVINRVYDGYMNEIKTVYGQLEALLQRKIEPAPDEWDRKYNVDFFIKVKDCFIGLQIKPVHQGIQLSQIFKEKSLQLKSHKQFKEKYGGSVFYIFSKGEGGKKNIVNLEEVDEIKKEIRRLEKE